MAAVRWHQSCRPWTWTPGWPGGGDGDGDGWMINPAPCGTEVTAGPSVHLWPPSATGAATTCVLRVQHAGGPVCHPVPWPGSSWPHNPHIPIPNHFGTKTGTLVGVPTSPERCGTAWAPAPGWVTWRCGGPCRWVGSGPFPRRAPVPRPRPPARPPRRGCQRGEVELGAAARTGLAGPEEVSGLGPRHAPLPAAAGAGAQPGKARPGKAQLGKAQPSKAQPSSLWPSSAQSNSAPPAPVQLSQCPQALGGDTGTLQRVPWGLWGLPGGS